MPTSKRAASARSTHAVAEAPVAVELPAPLNLGLAFATEDRSPFPDRYSIVGEEAALKDFLADPLRMADEDDPMYERYMELEDRRDRFHRMNADFQQRNGADRVASAPEAASINLIGSLVDEEEDTMTLHTLEGLRMFLGRTRQPGQTAPPIIGGKRMASALRNLWNLTTGDNPYADWALIRHERAIEEVKRVLTENITVARAVIDDAKQRGLSLSVLKSAEPARVTLGFKSPFGYAIAALVTDFDYFVRVQKTLARKHLCTDDDERASIANITRLIRRGFHEVERFDRWLSRTEVAALSRADFLPQANDAAQARVAFVTGVFGPVPGEIYAAKLQPSHSRRRIRVEEAERQLLATVARGLDQGLIAAVQTQGVAADVDDSAVTPGDVGTATTVETA